MARRLNTGTINLQEAIAASFVSQMAEMNKRRDELAAQSERRFAAIERELHEIRKVLLELPEAIRQLPEAIRQKIGFKTK